MSRYLVRIILHDDAPSADYNTLHDLLNEAGYGVLVMADGGQEFRLPRGEYVITTDRTCQDVGNEVLGLVDGATDHRRSLLVNPAGPMVWLGLEPVG